MKIFIDTEFTGLHKNTTLISIGLVDELGNGLYCELLDYDKNQVNTWLQENVIQNLWLEQGQPPIEENIEYYKGNKKYIRKVINNWLSKYEIVEWVSDVAHYDFVLLIDLIYEEAINIPYMKHSASIHDINQDIAKYYNISELEAFDKNREDILNSKGIEIKGLKHNALYDAKVIKEIYKIVNRSYLTINMNLKDIDEFKTVFEILKDERISEDIRNEYLKDLGFVKE